MEIKLPLTEALLLALRGVDYSLKADITISSIEPFCAVSLEVTNKIIYQRRIPLTIQMLESPDRDAQLDNEVHGELLTYFVRYGASMMGLISIEGQGSMHRWKVEDMIKAMIRFTYHRADAFGVELYTNMESPDLEEILYEQDINYRLHEGDREK